MSGFMGVLILSAIGAAGGAAIGIVATIVIGLTTGNWSWDTLAWTTGICAVGYPIVAVLI